MNLELNKNTTFDLKDEKALKRADGIHLERSLFDFSQANTVDHLLTENGSDPYLPDQSFGKIDSQNENTDRPWPRGSETSDIKVRNKSYKTTKKISHKSDREGCEQKSLESNKDSYKDSYKASHKDSCDMEEVSLKCSEIDQTTTPSQHTSSFHMVDIGDKTITRRYAKACGSIFLSPQSIAMIEHKKNPKGDVLAMAEIAGIIAAKDTSKLLPLCHPLQLDKVQIKFELSPSQISVSCEVYCHGKTGVEMEALTGATTALLTIYDLAKAVDPVIEIGSVFLETKIGGKSGEWRHPKLFQKSEKLYGDRLKQNDSMSDFGILDKEIHQGSFDPLERTPSDVINIHSSISDDPKISTTHSMLDIPASLSQPEQHLCTLYDPLNNSREKSLDEPLPVNPVHYHGEASQHSIERGTPHHLKASSHKRREVSFDRVEIGLITMSDRAAQGVYADNSGPVMDRFFQSRGAVVKKKAILPDSADHLRAELDLMVTSGFNLIAISGGTGLSPKDITPDVLESIATKKWYGFGEAQRLAGAKHTDFSWASRCAAYICHSTLVVLFPGKPKAVEEGLEATAHLIKHALEVLSEGNSINRQ